MRKLKLELDTLVVEAFSTGDAAGAGTVRAFEGAGQSEGGPATCQLTCLQSCFPRDCTGDTCPRRCDA
jgi:hypothetical protein